MTDPVRLAIVGAGALTEGVYLPVLKNNPFFQVVCLIDNHLPQAAKMAELYQVSQTYARVDDIPANTVDAALVVLPNFLHAPIALALLDKGIHVLVEKPMANTTSECEQLNEKAKQTGLKLAVGLVRRFYPTTLFLKEVLQHRLFGSLIHFDLEEGYVFDWKLQSDYLLSKKKAGGGVLMDTGIHLLDQMIYCIGEPVSIDYYDDNCGGVEADCKLLLTMENGATGTVSFSRIRQLRNSIVLQFEQATVEVGLNAQAEVIIRLSNGTSMQAPVTLGNNVFKNKNAFQAQLEDFYQSIRKDLPCKITGEEGMRSVQLVQRCYASRKSIHDLQTAF